jgi:hypothetical protein
MSVFFNITKPKLNQQGIMQRPKYGDGDPISLSYGKLVDITQDPTSKTYKAFFLLMSNCGSELKQPDEMLQSQFYRNSTPSEAPYSLKYTVNDDVVNILSKFMDKNLWFAYSANSVTKVIDKKEVSYLETRLIAFPDIIGMNGFQPLLEAIFKKDPASPLPKP